MKKLVAVICLIAFFATMSCVEGRYREREGRNEDRGNYIKTESFESFDGIKVARLLKAKVVKGDKFEVTIKVPERYKDQISAEIDSENNLVVTLTGEINKKRRDVFEAEITCPSFVRIIVEDLSKVSVISEFSAENMELSAYSLSDISFKEQLKVANSCRINAESSKIKVDISVESIIINSLSMSEVNASGTATSLEVEAHSMAKANCSKLIAKTVKATAHSMADVAVYADEKFDLEAGDMAKIRYSGDGEVIRKESGSMSSISKR